MALESPFFIVRSDALGIPVEIQHAFEDGLERLHIQREARKHDSPIMLSADEFYEFVLLMIPLSQ